MAQSSREWCSVGRLVIVQTTGLLVALPMIEAQAAAQPKTIQISMAKTFVRDRPKIFVDIAADEFKEVMKQTTGLNGKLIVKLTAWEIAEKLQDKHVDFGIMYAHEFAWAQQKYPDLRPLLIAATKKTDKRAHVIVHKNSPTKTIGDLRGKKLDLPLGTKEYCRIYLEKLCKDKAEGGSAGFFGSIAKSAAQIDALDAVARNEAHATVVDTIWLDFYKEVKGPVFAKNLKILQQSEVVPPAVIVYKKGALDQATVDRVRNGLRKAHTTGRGRILMALWHIDAFESVPREYSKSLADLLKEYPAPDPPR